jgi:hypothetical protein
MFEADEDIPRGIGGQAVGVGSMFARSRRRGATMKTLSRLLALALALPWLAAPGSAQELFVYPEKGQSADQQQKDEFECYRWAKDRTGFDPMAVPTTSRPPPAQETPTGGAGRGAVGGAALGAAVGKITGRGGGKGAAVGAVSGGMIGGMRRSDQTRREQDKQDRWAQEETARYRNERSQYNRAYAACLEGRGYSVK